MFATDEASIKELQERSGKKVKKIELSSCRRRQIIRAHTVSGGVYLFEIVDPIKPTAHMVRCIASRPDLKIGYHGQREVSPIFKLGKTIEQKDAKTGKEVTDEIKKLILVDEVHSRGY